jgi:hypothetical protein
VTASQRAHDGLRLGAALVAVATSPVMPDCQRYLALVARDRPEVRDVEAPSALADALGSRGALAPSSRALDIVGALVSFTDDHRAPFDAAMFPPACAHMLAELSDHAERRETLDRAAQLRLAARHAQSGFEALTICHAVSRQLARGRDGRALGVAPALRDRVRIGRVIAAFPPATSCGGDALGDTYHYWANVIAGVTAAQLDPLRRFVVRETFHRGAFLMRTIRDGVFGGTLFAGDHEAVDQLGLATGLVLGEARRGGRRDGALAAR